MSALSLPQARIPIAWVMINGQRVPAEIDMQWMRSLAGIFERTGGTSGPTNIVTYITNTVAPSVVLSSDEGSDEVMIPGPPGQQGPQGIPGPALYLLEDPVETETFWRV